MILMNQNDDTHRTIIVSCVSSFWFLQVYFWLRVSMIRPMQSSLVGFLNRILLLLMIIVIDDVSLHSLGTPFVLEHVTVGRYLAFIKLFPPAILKLKIPPGDSSQSETHPFPSYVQEWTWMRWMDWFSIFCHYRTQPKAAIIFYDAINEQLGHIGFA